MVDLALDEMQEMLQELARQFALDEIRPNAEKWDAESIYPLEAIKTAKAIHCRNLFHPPSIW